MATIQYTIRTVPKAVNSALRRVAAAENKSLNAVALEALTRGLALEATPTLHADLDGLIGTWEEDPNFDKAIAEFEKVDIEIWK